MPIELICECCSAKYRLDNSAAGKSLTCHQCGEVLAVSEVTTFGPASERPSDIVPLAVIGRDTERRRVSEGAEPFAHHPEFHDWATAPAPPNSLFLTARFFAVVFGLGLMLGPAILWYLMFVYAPSRRGRGGRGEEEGLFVLGGLFLLLAVAMAILGLWLVRLAVRPVATEADIRTDPESPPFADSAVICVSPASKQPELVPDDEDEPTRLVTSRPASPRETSKGALPTVPFGVSFQETESGWDLVAPITSSSTTYASGLLLVLSAFATFELLRSAVFDVLFLGIALPVMLAFGWQFARSSWGTLRISCCGDELTIFEGVGELGSTQTFDVTRMPEIKEATVTRKHAMGRVIRLSGDTVIQFGELLSDEHRDYIRSALSRLLLEQKMM